MGEQSLGALVDAGLAERVVGDASVCVRGIKHDSRRVEPGDLFAAVPGLSTHGSAYVGDAVARGAVAVLADRTLDADVPVLMAGDALLALSRVATRLYDDPTGKLDVIGITGTNGKTTVSYLLEAMLQELGARTAVIGTVEFRAPGEVRPATHTTPMADDLMRLCAWALEREATHLVLEVSSHALVQHRADGVHYRVAAFTNLSQDHLDYHGDFDAYGAAKRRLFVDLEPASSVVNVDDAFGRELARQARGAVLRCSKRADADAEVRVLEWSGDLRGIRARVETPRGQVELTSPLMGAHNLDNLLTALSCGLQLGMAPEALAQALSVARGAPGRLERVGGGAPAVFVDYAHTPDALERVLGVLRAASGGSLWVVFGAGGDRDRDKRRPMGAAAARLAHRLVLTSDNPRSEPPDQILAQLEEGVVEHGVKRLSPGELAGTDGYVVEPDRRAAIALAVAGAAQGDTVLIAGKGHEKVQIIGARRDPFDDCEEARASLAARRASR